jgi:hypothetical protein
MYCPECGSENEAVRPVCYRCGTSLPNLHPVIPASRRQKGWLGAVGNLWPIPVIGIVLLALAFALFFTLTPMPQPIPTSLPAIVTPSETPGSISAQVDSTMTPAPSASLVGRVIDHTTGQPIEGASVIAGDQQAVTDGQGVYVLPELLPGQYVVVAMQTGHDPAFSPIVSVREGESRQVDLTLYGIGESEVAADPLQTCLLDSREASTASDAEQLARDQGFTGIVLDAMAVHLRGKFWVNCGSEEKLHAAVAPLNHEGWVLTDERGQVWRIVRPSGNLAMPLPPGWLPPTPSAPIPSDSPPVIRTAQILFRGTDRNLWMINPDGTGEYKLTHESEFFHELYWDAEWSPDRTRILIEYAEESSPLGVYVLDIASGSMTKLTEGDMPRWSPNGERIAFVQLDSNGQQPRVFIYDLASGQSFSVLDSSQQSFAPFWSPDGSQVGFTWCPGLCDLYAKPVRGGDTIQLTNIGDIVACADWSPDGKEIVYGTTSFEAEYVWKVQVGDPSSAVILAGPMDVITCPKWSPDGSKIAYTGHTTGESCHVYIMNADGSNQHTIVEASCGLVDW